MQHTAYKALQSLGKSLPPYIGGICRFWFTPKENIASFPAIDPLTQMLAGEPVLNLGATWYGPVNTSNQQLGYTEAQEKGPAGRFYKRKISGFAQGSDSSAHINHDNLGAHEYVIIAQLRAGGYLIVLGNDETGMDYDHDFNAGTGANDTPGAKFSFTDECYHKALVLPEFMNINSEPPPTGGGGPGSGGGGGSDTNTTELIGFVTTNINTSIDLAWTDTRKEKFGAYPMIQVWVHDGNGDLKLENNIAITVDADPPSTTNFNIELTGAATGFITLK